MTRYAEQRALLADPRVSADMRRPGYPLQAPLPSEGEARIGFISMDGPEHTRLRRMVTTGLRADVEQAAAVCPALAITIQG